MWGLGVAAAYCAWALGIFALRGSRPLDRNGVTLAGVVTTYIAVGTLAGAVIGLLRPISRRPIGAYVAGFAAALPITAGIALLVKGLPAQWDYATRLTFPIVWMVFGVIAGRELRHHAAP